MKFFSKSLLAVLMFLLFVSIPLKAADGYHNYQELTQAIKNLVAKNSQVAKIQSMGKTLQGRDLWVIQMSGTKGVPEDKQALLIVGNVEGDHLIGSEVALGIAEYLIDGYGKDEQVTGMLDKRTFYIVPRLNPDGAEAFFAAVKEERAANFKPRDDDYDWQVDEDGPDDLNGDGLITQMRVKDRQGDWKIDANEPRLMKRKEADTPLDLLYSIYTEGLDDDGDGQYNEDGRGGFNIDRNFPHNFGYNPRGLGVYAASEVETMALLDFVYRYNPDFKGQPHRNICGVLVFSKYDNLAAGTGIECGTPTFPEPSGAQQAPGGGMMMMMFRMGGRRGAPVAEEPPPTDPQPKRTESRDVSLFTEVSDQYKAITGISTAVSEQPFGSLLEWAYFQYGVPSFSANLWSLRQESEGRPQMKQQAPAAQRGVQPGQAQTADRSAMVQRFSSMRAGGGASPAASTGNDELWLKWIDEKNEGKGFVAWTKFNHKQLGEVEIGGFEPYLRVNPPAGQIPELSQSHAKFALYLASQFAEIILDEPVVEKLGSNLFKLTVKVKNGGKFPYVSAMGTRTRNITPIVLQLKFEDEDAMEFFGGTNRTDISNLDPGAETEFSWTIISPPGKGIDISLWARNGGGTMKKKVVLK
jgi:murein tripeptide amidase MpaA